MSFKEQERIAAYKSTYMVGVQCCLGDRKGIWPVKIFTPIMLKGLLLEHESLTGITLDELACFSKTKSSKCYSVTSHKACIS